MAEQTDKKQKQDTLPVNDQKPSVPVNESLDQAISDYLLWMKSNRYSLKTVATYKSALKHFVIFTRRSNIAWQDIFLLRTLIDFQKGRSKSTAHAVRGLSRYLFQQNRISQPIGKTECRLPKIYEDYLAYHERSRQAPYRRMKQIKRVLAALHDYLKRHNIDLSSLNIDHIDAFLAKFFATFAPKTRKAYRSIIRGFLNYLYHEHRMIKKDLAPLVVGAPIFGKAKPPTFLRPHEVKKLFASVQLSTPLDIRTMPIRLTPKVYFAKMKTKTLYYVSEERHRCLSTTGAALYPRIFQTFSSTSQTRKPALPTSTQSDSLPASFVAIVSNTKALLVPPYTFAGRPTVYRCRNCKRDTSLTAGTIMHRRQQPLNSWFWAAFLVTSLTPGMSAVQFKTILGIKRYETVFQMLHKLRASMVRPERGSIGQKFPVEVDETFVGGATQGKGRGMTDKVLVVGAVEVMPRRESDKWGGRDPNLMGIQLPKHRGGHGRGILAGRLRLQVIPNRKQETLVPFVQTNVVPGAEVRTDAWVGYEPLTAQGYRHEAVAICGDHAKTDKHLPMIHIAFGNLDAWLIGTHHGVSPQHLQAYLNEYVFRFNRRFWPMVAFDSVLGIAVRATPPTYTGLYEGAWEHPGVWQE